MIGIPGQTFEDLCHDIRTFQALDLDMIGMGPYITSPGADMLGEGMMEKKALMRLALNMIAVTRLVIPDINIAAATALQALEDDGREKGIMHGCNVIMPNITPRIVRKNYQLYANKPFVEQEPSDSNKFLQHCIEKTGRTVGLNVLGSSIHWKKRTGQIQ